MFDAVISIATTAITVPMLAYAVYLLMHADIKIKRRGALVGAGASAIQLVAALFTSAFTAPLHAVVLGGFLALWWYLGGGDGLKRRLKSWAASFGPKTAPQGA